MKQICRVCGKSIRMMIFKNTGVCSERCGDFHMEHIARMVASPTKHRKGE